MLKNLTRSPPSPLPPPLAADIKYYRYILQTVHAGADMDFIVGAAKGVLEQAGDHALMATLDEVSGG